MSYTDKFQKLAEARENAANITELNLMHATPFSDEDIRLFKHITSLYLCANYGLDLEGIGQYTNLEYLRISECDIKKWILEPFLLPNLKDVELRWNKPSKYNAPFQKLFRKVIQEQYPSEIRSVLFYLTANDKQQLKEYSSLQLLEALVCDMPEIQAAVEKELEKRKENPLKDAPLSKESLVYITGKIHTPLTQMKERLQAQGIKVTSKLTKETTHIVVGIKPKENLEELAKSNTLLIEKHVTDFLNHVNTPYLMEESASKPNMVNNVVALLMSDDETNQLTGIEILKTGGVTNEVLTHLAALRYLRVSTKVSNAVKSLINQYGSPGAKAAITKNIRFDVNESTVYTNTNKLIKGTELDGLVFSNHLFSKIGNGRKYLLDKGTTEMRKAVIEKSLSKDGTKLDLSDLQFTKFPEEIFDYDTIEEINLYQHKIKKLPAGIGRMKNLVRLNLYGNPLEQIPEDLFSISSLRKLFIEVEDESLITNGFAKLQLDELYIFYTKAMNAFPNSILQISTLKKLAITPKTTLWIDKKNELLHQIPKEITQLKNLEGIYFDFNDLNELPESIGSLPKLKVLSVSHNDNLKKLPKSLKHSSSLKTFYSWQDWSKINKEELGRNLPLQCTFETSKVIPTETLFKSGL